MLLHGQFDHGFVSTVFNANKATLRFDLNIKRKPCEGCLKDVKLMKCHLHFTGSPGAVTPQRWFLHKTKRGSIVI